MRMRSHPRERSVNADPRTISPASAQQPPADPGSNGTHRASADSKDSRSTRRWHVWLFRIRALLFVTLCATFGVLLTIVPWTPKWTDNPLLLNFPDLRNIVSSGFVRGAISGLGILNLWVGFWEAIHYHEPSG
jgi:hypothetical protein